MNYDKIIKDSRGTIRINVRLWMDGYGRKDKDGNLFRYDAMVFHCPPRKRTEKIVEGVATPDEIEQAKQEFWNLLNPNP